MTYANLRYLCLLLGLVPMLCSAQVYSYITKSSGSRTNATYQFVIESWDTDDTSRNPCYGLRRCAVGVNHRHTNAGKAGISAVRPSAYVVGSTDYPEITELRTMGELSRFYQTVYSLPIQGTTSHLGTAIAQECVGLFFVTNSGGSKNVNGGALMPGSICGIAPPPIGVCGIEEQQLTLDHGTLSDKQLVGSIAKGSLRVVCSQNANINISIRTASNGRLELGNNSGIYSTLRVNGRDGNQGYRFSADKRGVTIPITSTLGVTGAVKAGDYSGQTVAILSFP